MQTFTTNSESETQKIAESMAEQFKDGGVIALVGDLGAGKTTFVQGLATGLGIKDKVISPTFVLMRQHQIPNTSTVFYHLDLYRLDEPVDIIGIGLKDLFENPENIILIEWAEKIAQDLPNDILKIAIEKLEGSNRRITVVG